MRRAIVVLRSVLRAVSDLRPSRLAERERRRRAEEAAQGEEVLRDARAILDEVTGPLLRDGSARLESRRDDFLEDDVLALTPADPDAAQVTMWPNAHSVDLWVGPEEHLHEVLVGVGTDWRAELRGCLEAVVAGRYTETIVPSPRGKRLRMVFETTEPIVVQYVGAGEYGPFGERRFAPYRRHTAADDPD